MLRTGTKRGAGAVGRRAGMRARRGVMLMEVVLALALVVLVGMVVLSAVSESSGALRRSRQKQVAVDLARSAMAKLEAGIETTNTLTGPVKAWSEDANLAEVPDEGQDTGWELDILTEPSGFDALTYVSVTARQTTDGKEATGAAVSYTLRQLVRLAPKGEDATGEKDAVTIEAEKARPRTSSPTGKPPEAKPPARPGSGGGP